MNETDLQAKTIAAVKEMGGEAHKMSNRFLVGVVDLFIKFPACPAWIVEAKYVRVASPRTASVKAEVSPPQGRFMSKYHAVGLDCFVLMFTEFPRAPGKLRGSAQEKGVILRRWPGSLIYLASDFERVKDWRGGIVTALGRQEREMRNGRGD